MQSPPFPRYLVPPRPKYSPQHHILKHPQLPFLPQCQRTSFTPVQIPDHYSPKYFWNKLYLPNGNKRRVITVITLDCTSYNDPILGHAHSYQPDYTRNDDLYTPLVDRTVLLERLSGHSTRCKQRRGDPRISGRDFLYKHEGYLCGRPTEITSLSILGKRGPVLLLILT